MARPSKFDMGDVPRTRTGLVPISYRQKADELSFPWSPLPMKPKPPMYRYRGDYVNERNRKLLIKQKLALKKKHKYFDRSNTCENEGLGSILKITPYSSITAEVKLSSEQASNLSNKTVSWDPYHKHASLHRLSKDEECARAKNRSKFVSYLRVEALKRHERKEKEMTDKKESPHNSAEVIVRQRKPPVPRLSHLARSRQQNENTSNGPQQLFSQTKPKSICTTNESQPKVNATNNAKTTAGYLDYISKKSDCPQEQSTELIGLGSTITRQNVKNEIDDYRTKFRSQIQRIVEKAADMVLNDQDDRQGTLTATNSNTDHATSNTIERHDSKLGPSTIHASDDFFNTQNKKLTMLEEQILSMASTVVSESSLSFIGTDTFDSLGSAHVQRENCMSLETARDNKLEIKARGGSKLRQTDTQRQQSFHRKTTKDLLNSSDSSSSCDTSFLTDIYYPQIHGKISGALVDEKSTTTCPSTTTSWSGMDSAELMPRLLVQPNNTFFSHPYLDPFWEDEPIPRGCDHVSHLLNHNYDSEEEAINLKTEMESFSRSDSIADDIFSLL